MTSAIKDQDADYRDFIKIDYHCYVKSKLLLAVIEVIYRANYDLCNHKKVESDLL